jgi:hypothetical protein
LIRASFSFPPFAAETIPSGEYSIMTENKIENSQTLGNLVEQITKGECILFLGAGIHYPPPKDSPYSYPQEHRPLSAKELAAELNKSCHYDKKCPDDSIHDLQRVSLCFETDKTLGRNELVNTLDRLLRVGKKPSPALKMLAGLPFKIIVTTNYDRLLETALREANKDPDVYVYNPDPGNTPTPDSTQDPSESRPMVFKMHGDLSQEKRKSIVITDEDYILFVQRMSEKDTMHPVPATIRFRIKKWPTLFVGYSLKDYNLRLLFRTLRWHVDPANFPVSYSVDLHPDPLILSVWQDEMRFITFITQDFWTFIPWIRQQVSGKEYPRG